MQCFGLKGPFPGIHTQHKTDNSLVNILCRKGYMSLCLLPGYVRL